ncbi:anhydro-N-acetylmuramic acid kinase [Ferrimonas balearica]|nr:anhydro-N-acetylmuramic acid kinase [Ferrimonas balearica]
MTRHTTDKPVLRVLGAMSGTSLDGVDAAVVETDGQAIRAFGPSAYRPYSEAERATLADALGLWPGPDPDPRIEAAQQVVLNAHADLLAQFDDIDLVGFHGQTLAHEPRGRGTFQTGDGATLADRLGVPVVWDFRSADVHLGGEGAPLAPFYHHALARHMGAAAPVAFLNLGGVGNITWADPRLVQPEAPGALLSFDTGPANAPLNDLMQARRGRPFDRDGALAAQGSVAEGTLETFLEDRYFYRIPPKSLDRNQFGDLPGLVAGLSDADAAATLTAICAASVLRGMEHLPEPPTQLLVTGGGRLNPVLMEMLAVSLDCPVRPVEDSGFDGDMLEAQAFAFLAARVLHGLPTSCEGTTGVRMAVGGGEISRPSTPARTPA